MEQRLISLPFVPTLYFRSKKRYDDKCHDRVFILNIPILLKLQVKVHSWSLRPRFKYFEPALQSLSFFQKLFLFVWKLQELIVVFQESFTGILRFEEIAQLLLLFQLYELHTLIHTSLSQLTSLLPYKSQVFRQSSLIPPSLSFKQEFWPQRSKPLTDYELNWPWFKSLSQRHPRLFYYALCPNETLLSSLHKDKPRLNHSRM